MFFLTLVQEKIFLLKIYQKLIKDITGYKGNIVFDKTKPDGMPQKLLDVTNIEKAGWHYKTELRNGLERTYQWYLENYSLFNGGKINA